ncbi:hypothetical protein HH214_14920 [Mucilaginibacter robiniae]|uniref:Uncharacterized protein n=1 Tax=Mucilaginibacter robiniae TaxID=2728022 RepID=A0A7L5E3B5_9SPHI|nr:hypothetical protein [Mucilaginibacter robiniae]QJD97068.1 hypothetical protein HH214_14920 [Mucilaginibacter robiniae]
MQFEEFFKKKKISLDALQQGDPTLFSEFKMHYEQMGEKSFDHTKKYWFNKLRHQYPLPPEVKVEKLTMENRVAEQTVADTLTEETPVEQNAKLGFKPKFRAAAVPKPATPTAEQSEEKALPPTSEPKPAIEASESASEEQPAPETPKPITAKPAYKPRFQAKTVATAKPAAESPDTEQPVASTPSQPAPISETKLEPPVDTTASITAVPAPKLGFKPRFKTTEPAPVPAPEVESKITESPKEEKPAPAEHPLPATELPTTPVEEKPEAPKPAYKPRFNPNMVKPKPPEEGEGA